jgi:nicotinate dehydrogenase subunit A
MYTAALLKKTPRATDEQIKDALGGLKCRCGTHASILRAVRRAQKAMA